MLPPSRDRLEIDLVIPVTDEIIIPLDRIRHRFPARCRLAIAPSEALRLAADKQRTVELAEQLGIDETEGVYVAGIEKGSGADKGGIREGDIIKKIDNFKIGK